MLDGLDDRCAEERQIERRGTLRPPAGRPYLGGTGGRTGRPSPYLAAAKAKHTQTTALGHRPPRGGRGVWVDARPMAVATLERLTGLARPGTRRAGSRLPTCTCLPPHLFLSASPPASHLFLSTSPPASPPVLSASPPRLPTCLPRGPATRGGQSRRRLHSRRPPPHPRTCTCTCLPARLSHVRSWRRICLLTPLCSPCPQLRLGRLAAQRDHGAAGHPRCGISRHISPYLAISRVPRTGATPLPTLPPHRRLGKLASSKDSRHMLYLALFVVAVILLIYKLR